MKLFKNTTIINCPKQSPQKSKCTGFSSNWKDTDEVCKSCKKYINKEK